MARDGGSCASEVIGSPVRISPPSSVRWAASASAMAWEPPSATGQPTACPAARRTSANEVVSRWSRGRKACAAHPANRAWASSVVNQVRPARDAGTSAGSPNRVRTRGWRGTFTSEPVTIGARSSQRSAIEPTQRR